MNNKEEFDVVDTTKASAKDAQNNPHSNKRKKKRFTKRGKKGDRDRGASKFNDVSWYAKNPQILADAASLSYNMPLGFRIPMTWQNENSDIPLFFSNESKTIPGIMAYDVVIGPGRSDNAASPANIAANNIYSYVRYMNSGAKNYDQADLMLYLLAMDSCYAMFNWLKRAYGVARLYDQSNFYLPDGLLTAMRISPNSITQSLADVRARLNVIAAKLSAFCVPATMPLFIRHSWMFSNIYKDADNKKAQLYLFNPAGFYMFSETGSQFGGSLTWKRLANQSSLTYTHTGITVYLSELEAMINVLSYSEDIGVMSGDILKAYGQNRLFTVSPISEDYTVLPVYNEEVLNQMHNSNLVPVLPHDTTAYFGDITQNPDTGYLIYKPYGNHITNQANIEPRKVILNMPWNDVTPANTMVATRLVSTFTLDLNLVTVLACGSEFVSSRRILTRTGTGATEFAITVINDNAVNLGIDDTMSVEDIRKLITTKLDEIAAMTQFDWHPIAPVITKNSMGGLILECYIGDFTNYTIVDLPVIETLHLTAIMSEFDVPQIGSF